MQCHQLAVAAYLLREHRSRVHLLESFLSLSQQDSAAVILQNQFLKACLGLLAVAASFFIGLGK
jgi:hypothetical protein